MFLSDLHKLDMSFLSFILEFLFSKRESKNLTFCAESDMMSGRHVTPFYFILFEFILVARQIELVQICDSVNFLC